VQQHQQQQNQQQQKQERQNQQERQNHQAAETGAAVVVSTHKLTAESSAKFTAKAHILLLHLNMFSKQG
jgi:hypothetical protein